jgi:hypothetical protein
MDGGHYGKTAACDQFHAELNAFLEGESKPFVTAHARECLFCGPVLADLEQIRVAAQALPLEEPSAAVWANIRAQLARDGFFREPGSQRGWLERLHLWPHPAPLGALASLVALGVFLTVLPSHLPSPLGTSGSSQMATAVSSLGSGQEADLTRVIQGLEKTYQANAKYLAPDVKATYDKGLESLNASIRESLASLRSEPDNTLAHEYLMDAYSRKAEVLASALEFEGQQ